MRAVAGLMGIVVGIFIVGGVLMPIVSANSSDGEHTLDVVVIAGQSNAAYIVDYMDLDVVNETYGEPSTNCYYYGYQTSGNIRPCNNLGDLSYTSAMDIHSMYVDGEWAIGGEEVGIATTVSEYTNDDVLTINVGLPGHEIAYYEPDADGGAYISEILEDALSKIPDTYTTVNKVGWMWCQGESDKTTAVADYVASFIEVQSIFEDYGFGECFLVQTRPADSGNATAAQTKIVETVANVTLSSTAPASFTVANGGLIDGNSLHYTQYGRDVVGEDVGETANHFLSVHLRDTDGYSIISVVPVFVILGIVMVSVGYVVTRDD